MNVLFLWLLISDPTGSVEMTKDDSLCRQSLQSFAPTTASSANVIAALVQIDSTFGITPCQYMVMKGISPDGAASPDLDNHFQEVSSTNDPNQQAIQAMSDASDMSVGDEGSKESAAEQAGQKVGSSIDYGITHVGTGLADVAQVGVEGVNDIARSIGLPNIDPNLDVFKDLNWKMGDKWAYKAGQELYDITSDGMTNTYEFFSGVAEGILGPSVQGRRRTVYDADCDNVQHEVDSIESLCNTYRYDKLTQMYPMIQSTASMDFGINTNTTILNNTYDGDPLSFTPGVKEVFLKHQEALYGIGGTCLDPTKGSVALESSLLTAEEFSLADDISSAMDTEWTNLDTIDSNEKTALTAVVSGFTNATIDRLDRSAEVGQMTSELNVEEIGSYLSTVGSLMGTMTKSINNLQAQQETNFGTIDNKSANAVAASNKATAQLLDLLDLTSDTLYNSPDAGSQFSDTLVNSVAQILGGANSSAQSAAQDQTQLSVTTAGTNYLNVFSQNLLAALGQASKSLATTTSTLMSSTTSDYLREQSKLTSSQTGLANQFASTAAIIMSDLADSATNNTRKFSGAQTGSSDAASAAKQLQAQVASTSAMLTQMFSALNTNDKDLVSDITTKITNALNEANSGVADQLTALGQGLSAASGDIADSNNGLATTFSGLVSQLSKTLAARASGAANSASSQTGLLQTTAALSSDQLQTLTSYHAGQLDAASANWKALGDDALAGLNDVVGEIQTSQSGSQDDAQTALRASQSQLGDSVVETSLNAAAAARAGRASVYTAGQSTVGLTRAAGTDLSDQHDQMASLLGQLSGIGLNAASTGTSDVASGVAGSLATALGSTTSAYASSLQQAKSAAGSQLDQAQSTLQNQALTTSSAWKTRLGTFVGGIDRSADQAAKSSSSSDQTSISLNSIGDQLAAVGQSDAGPGSLSDGMAAASSSSGVAAGTTVAGLSQSYLSLQSQLQASVDQTLGVLPPSPVSTSAATATIQSSDRAVLSAGTNMQATLTSLSQNNAGSDIAGIALEQMDSEASFAAQTAALTALMHAVFSSSRDQLGNLNATFVQWNASQSTNVSAAVQAFIAALGADGMRLMDQIAAGANGSVVANAAFGAASAINLDQAGSLADGFANHLPATPNVLTNTTGMQNQIFDAQQYLSQMAGQAVSVHDYQAATLAASQRNAGTLQSQLGNALSSSNATLTLSAARAASDASFQSNMTQAQNAALLRGVNTAVGNTGSVAAESSSSLGSTLVDSTSAMADLESNLQGYSDRLGSNLAAGLAGMGSQDSGFIANISSDKNQVAVQLQMAQRSVRDLLQSWGHYADYETHKFQKMNASDYEYISVMGHRIDTTNISSGGSLRTSAEGLAATTGTIMDALGDYVSFRNYMQSGVASYQGALNMLNETADAAIAQAKESMFNLDANDEFIDQSNKNEVGAAVKKFESDIDAQALMATQSVG